MDMMNRFFSGKSRKGDSSSSVDSRSLPPTLKRSSTPVTCASSGHKRGGGVVPKFSRSLFSSKPDRIEETPSVTSSSSGSPGSSPGRSPGRSATAASKQIQSGSPYYLSVSPTSSLETSETRSIGFSFDTEDGANSILTDSGDVTTATGRTEQRCNLSPIDSFDDYSECTDDTYGSRSANYDAYHNVDSSFTGGFFSPISSPGTAAAGKSKRQSKNKSKSGRTNNFGLTGIGISSPAPITNGGGRGGYDGGGLSSPSMPSSPPRPTPGAAAAITRVAGRDPPKILDEDIQLKVEQQLAEHRASSAAADTARAEDTASAGWAVEAFLSKFSCICTAHDNQ